MFTLTDDWKKFHNEVLFLENIFHKCLFPLHFIDKCIKLFSDKGIHSVEKQKLNNSLPFLGKYANEIKTIISSIASRYLLNTKVVIVWNSQNKLLYLFPFKDRLHMHLRSKILCRFTCNGCNSIYLGKTKWHFLVRAYKHLGIYVRTGNQYTYNPRNGNDTAILDHLHQSKNCHGKFDDFEVLKLQL